MRRWFIILHWVFHLPFSTLRISTVPLELKLGISQEDDAKSFDLNEFLEEDFHSYRSQPITSCPVLERFDGSNNESSEQEMMAEARHSFHQTISFPVIKSEDRGDQEPLTHYEIPRSECSTTSSLRRKNNALFINQRAKRPKQETFPIGYASTKKETPTSNRRAKNTLAKGGKRFLLESEKSLAQRNRARGASQSHSKTEIMYVKGEPVADQDTKDNIIKLELVDHFGLEESQKKGVLFNVNDWKFITEERQDLIENEYPGKFFEFLNNLKGDDQDASVPEKRASFFLTRESAMGFLKKYLSSRTEFEDESGIKKDQKKELVMRTLLRISDRKLKLAENRFYADELLGRIKDRLKLEHDSCLDPVQVPRLPTIIQFVENVTKTTHLLIIIYLALFKEHQAAEGGEFGAEESEKILRFIGQLWQDIADNSPGLPQTKWTAKLSELFQFQNKRSRAASVMTNRKKPMYILCCHLLHYWIDKNGKAFKNCKNIDKYNGTLVELINKLVFYSNYHSILAHTFNKNKKR
ncbi:uncharacterized protein PGTG_03992 [Puccinia graminis f. sp. tritici CRL 75-36-700-3]|uniref:Uncharacterized protein n=1 Tax=Puccinia graminis f. sp. tritici (strain CRL 75-36-700-3 / race SCCL) TaxID=418459 RepID=E3K161_PUCGT|nr:uncharacterized protein PGTG_03992 [Puccinia graminis f. sp. tritici CRL 75-36-700-3]EFP78036.2 hypothetical protein PGTG_03992 [Puccinia graminis f. sp. tritici CRL 75-36-700-3]